MKPSIGISAATLTGLYRTLSLIRRVELKIEELYSQDEMKTPVHLSLGQEAVSAGVCAHLAREDYAFSNHRSHAHYLAKGGDLKKMIAELYCKETGCSRGRGGSMHLIDVAAGLPGSSSIVGGSIPHAVGAALASQMRKDRRIAVSFFGDAAIEEGVLYESMNFAALKKVPVIFVCEHNYYSVYSHLSSRQATDDIAHRPRGFRIPSRTVDGMSVLDVFRAAKKAVAHARAEKGPFFLECVVQRWRGHAGAGDPLRCQYRMPHELDEKNTRCPVAEFERRLIAARVMTRQDIKTMNESIDVEITQAFTFARESPLPDKKSLHNHVYCE